jgi:hypothetical protein
VPPDLDDFIASLLARDSSERPASAAAVSRELAKWAGGDLTARVAESIEKSAANLEQDDSAAAQRSLCELLGADSKTAAEKPAKTSPGGRRGSFSRNARRTLAAAAAFGAIAYGTVILLRTPDGMLEISSDLETVTVEAVREGDAIATKIAVEQGKGETVLRAGKYKVRLAENHAGFDFDEDEITLKRGERVVARIRRVPNVAGAAAAAPGWPHSQVLDEQWKRFQLHHARLDMSVSCLHCHSDVSATSVLSSEMKKAASVYKGKLESEWQKLFLAETEPIAKLEAGQALIHLAVQRPPAEQLRQILNVGEEIVRAAYGHDSVLFGLNRSIPPQWMSHWSPNFGRDDYSAFGNFQSQVNEVIRQLPPKEVAPILCQAVVEGNDPRAAFACSLVSWAALDSFGDPSVARGILSKLEAPQPTPERSAVTAVVRARLINHAADEQRARLSSELIELADRLRVASESELNRQLSQILIKEVVLIQDLRSQLHDAIARLLLGEIKKGRMNAVHAFRSDVNAAGMYVGSSGSSRVVHPNLFWNAWIRVANEHLRAHSEPPYDKATGEVVRSLDIVLRSWSDRDEWPVDRTAYYLTLQLGRYYSANPNAPTRLLEDLLPASAAEMLTPIVRITGRIPESVRTAHPRLKDLDTKLQNFDAFLTGGPRGLDNRFAGLFDAAPYQVIQRSLGEIDESKLISRVGGGSIPHGPRLALTYASTGLSITGSGIGGKSNWDSYVDPLLLLAVLVEEAGESEAKDTRIAALVKEIETGWQSVPYESSLIDRRAGLKVHLQRILESDFAYRAHVLRMLDEVAAKAKSQALKDAIKDITPTSADAETQAERASGRGG